MSDFDPRLWRQIMAAAKTVPPPAEGEIAGEACPRCGQAPVWRYRGRPIARVELGCTCKMGAARPIEIRPPNRTGTMRPIHSLLGDDD